MAVSRITSFRCLRGEQQNRHPSAQPGLSSPAPLPTQPQALSPRHALPHPIIDKGRSSEQTQITKREGLRARIPLERDAEMLRKGGGGGSSSKTATPTVCGSSRACPCKRCVVKQSWLHRREASISLGRVSGGAEGHARGHHRTGVPQGRAHHCYSNRQVPASRLRRLRGLPWQPETRCPHLHHPGRDVTPWRGQWAFTGAAGRAPVGQKNTSSFAPIQPPASAGVRDAQATPRRVRRTKAKAAEQPVSFWAAQHKATTTTSLGWDTITASKRCRTHHQQLHEEMLRLRDLVRSPRPREGDGRTPSAPSPAREQQELPSPAPHQLPPPRAAGGTRCQPHRMPEQSGGTRGQEAG